MAQSYIGYGGSGVGFGKLFKFFKESGGICRIEYFGSSSGKS